jgi:PEGA domain
MRAHRILSVCVLAALLARSSASRADEDALSDTARELFLKGVKAWEQQKWDQCRAALLAAFAIKRHTQIAGNLADCELRLGKDRDAAEHAWFFAHGLRPDAPTERRAAAEALLKQAQAKVGTLVVTVDADGADVLVDGQSAGKTPLRGPVFVEPGRHVVEALRAGGPGAQATADVGAGETREVELMVNRQEKPPPPPPPPLPQQHEKRPIWPAFVMGGGALVAVAIGAGLTVAANGKGSAADRAEAMLPNSGPQAPCATYMSACATIVDDRQAHDVLARGALGTFIAGGVLGVATLAYAVAALKRSAGTEVKVVPVVGTDRAGVAVLGAW